MRTIERRRLSRFASRCPDETRRPSPAPPPAGEVVIAIAALKADLLQGGESVAVPESEVERLAETLGVLYLPTSAKTDRNVRELFQRVADRVLLNRKHARSARPAAGGRRDNGEREPSMENERVKISSPRKRDKYDERHALDRGDDHDLIHDEDGNELDDVLCTPVKTKRGIFFSVGGKHSRAATPNTETTDGENTSSTNGGKNEGSLSSKTKHGLCTDETFYACGAADGNFYCSVQ